MLINVFKNNIGSITLFFITAILFFLISTLSSYYFSNNIRASQMHQVKKIEKEYAVELEQMKVEYDYAMEQNF